MFEIVIRLFSVTLVRIALGADNLILITILAGRLPVEKGGAVRLGLILATFFDGQCRSVPELVG